MEAGQGQEEKKYFSSQDAADELGIHAGTLRRNASELGIVGKRFKGSKRVYYSREDIEAFKAALKLKHPNLEYRPEPFPGQ